MLRTVVKSKIHRATVTRSDLDYEGSFSIDRELMRLADILPGEQVHVLNLANGTRRHLRDRGRARRDGLTARWPISAAPATW